MYPLKKKFQKKNQNLKNLAGRNFRVPILNLADNSIAQFQGHLGKLIVHHILVILVIKWLGKLNQKTIHARNERSTSILTWSYWAPFLFF
jgi:hypothetical protein